MRRTWIWLQLLLGWLPVCVLYAAMILAAHPPTGVHAAAFAAVTAIVPAALLGLLVRRVTQRVPWPIPFQAWFALLHLGAAAIYSITWYASAIVVNIALRHLAGAPHELSAAPVIPFLVVGVWLYVMIAGISYAIDATERAARSEAAAARAQLGALRSQLHPHFLFNTLHTVVQLIPRDPARAAEAAEQVAALLRTAVGEMRDEVTLEEEWNFVSRYLDLERMRFGDRLRVVTDIQPSVQSLLVPSFALQTLVENAVRHGAQPRIEPTTLHVDAAMERGRLVLRVRDDGAGATADALRGERASGERVRDAGTGLARLRERIAVMYGAVATLDVTPGTSGGVSAMLALPPRYASDADA